MSTSFALFSSFVLLMFVFNGMMKAALKLAPEKNRNQGAITICKLVDSFLGTTLIFLAISMIILTFLQPMLKP
jgi:hypothetical protein